MIEIVNKQKSPVQVVLRSKVKPRSLTVLNIPGIGRGDNVRIIEDEQRTELLDRLEQMKLITTRQVNSKSIRGE